MVVPRTRHELAAKAQRAHPRASPHAPRARSAERVWCITARVCVGGRTRRPAPHITGARGGAHTSSQVRSRPTTPSEVPGSCRYCSSPSVSNTAAFSSAADTPPATVKVGALVSAAHCTPRSTRRRTRMVRGGGQRDLVGSNTHSAHPQRTQSSPQPTYSSHTAHTQLAYSSHTAHTQLTCNLRTAHVQLTYSSRTAHVQLTYS